VAKYSIPHRYTTKQHNEKTYLKLNKKLISLAKHTQTVKKSTQKEQPTQTRVINLTNKKVTKEQIDIMALGPN
jgi:hypothetical protein